VRRYMLVSVPHPLQPAQSLQEQVRAQVKGYGSAVRAEPTADGSALLSQMAVLF